MVYQFKGKKNTLCSSTNAQTVIVEREPKKKNRFLSWLGRFFMLLGVMAFISSISTFVMIANLGKGGDDDPASIANGAILTYHFEGGLSDTAPDASLSDPFAAMSPSMHDVAYLIREAANDDNVKAFVARISPGQYSMSELMEIKGALMDYRASGKKSYAYASAYGDFSNGTTQYILALGFDEIWMQPMGQITLSGFHAEVPYLKSTLEKLGIEAQIFQRKDYKTAPESILRNDMTPENKASLKLILANYDDAFFEAVMTADRDVDIQQLKSNIYRKAPVTDKQALELKLIDRLGYVDELTLQLEETYGLKIKSYRNLLSYDFPKDDDGDSWLASGETNSTAEKASAAIIFVDGAIMDREPSAQLGPMAFLGGPVAGALKISSTIKKAAEDENIDAIILRVNSPGGSPTASETLRRAVIYAQNKGKKIYLSMGGAAASGGYWMSANADYIMAYPTTLTGSIGVFGGKMNLEGLWDKIGINWEYVIEEDALSSSLWSQNRPYGPQAKVVVNQMLDRIYDNFVTLVSEARGMSYEDAEKLARGRVWMGTQAKENGLIDAVGTLENLIQKTANDLGVSRENLNIRVMPEPLSIVASLIRAIKKGPQLSAQAQATLEGVPTISNEDAIKSYIYNLLFGVDGQALYNVQHGTLLQLNVMPQHIK
jgi:protease-4